MDANAVEHLLNRAGFGARQAEIASGVRMGREAFIDALFEGFGEDPEPFFVREYDRKASEGGVIPKDREALKQLRKEYKKHDRRQMTEYAAWWFDQMRSGDHPLRERMTLFWHGHSRRR